jgi:hypothetical protein
VGVTVTVASGGRLLSFAVTLASIGEVTVDRPLRNLWTLRLVRPGPPLTQWRVLQLPHWCLVIATAVLPAWYLRRRFRWRDPAICPACGYDLRGGEGTICPECGAEREAEA